MKTETMEFAAKNGWVEIKEPELIKLEKIGDEVCGVLLALNNEKIDGREVMTARMETSNAAQVKFRLQFDLRQKLGRRHIGKTVLIVLTSEQQTGKDSPMKMFTVFVKPDSVDTPPPFIASDNDLPDTI